MNYSVPGFPVLYYLLEFAQTHMIELVMLSISPSVAPPPALNLSQHQGLF